MHLFTEPKKVSSNSLQTALVSAIIPTYNRPDYLKIAIESAVRQTYGNLEIIVADDCGPFNLQKLVDTFQDPRIFIRRNSTNLGVQKNIVDALKNARGKYVASLNDDDMWKEDFLEKLVPLLESNPDLALAFCNHDIIDSNGRIDRATTEKIYRQGKRHQLKEGIYQPFWKMALVDYNVNIACGAVIRKDAIDWDSFPPEIVYYWDFYLAYIACRSGRGAYYYPENLTRYRVHKGSMTAAGGRRESEVKIAKAKDYIFCYERIMQDERVKEVKPYLQQKWARENTSLGIGLMRSKKAAEARPYFLKALGQKFDLRTVAALGLSFAPRSLSSRF